MSELKLRPTNRMLRLLQPSNCGQLGQNSCREHAQPRSSRNASTSTISRGRARCAAGDFCFPLRRRRSPSCGSRGTAFAATAACTPPEVCPPRTRCSRSNARPATCPTWVFTTQRSSTRSASRAMTAPLHHATQAFTPSCASCHADHRGAIRLAATSDANCTQCHANLATRGSSTSFVRNIGSFESNHPEFAVLRSGRRDPGTIQLNHYLHLQPNLLGPNGSRVQMVCADCHRSAADAGGPWPYGDSKSQAGTRKRFIREWPEK